MQHNKNLLFCLCSGVLLWHKNKLSCREEPASCCFGDSQWPWLWSYVGRDRQWTILQVCCAITTLSVFINSVMVLSWKRKRRRKTYGGSKENTLWMQEKVVCQFLRWIPSWTPKYTIIPSFVSFACPTLSFPPPPTCSLPPQPQQHHGFNISCKGRGSKGRVPHAWLRGSIIED